MLARNTALQRRRTRHNVLDGVFTGLWFSLVVLMLFATCYPVS